jgi:hypothetical protein
LMSSGLLQEWVPTGKGPIPNDLLVAETLEGRLLEGRRP